MGAFAANRLGHFGLRDPRLQSVLFQMIVPTTINTAGNVTYSTTQLLNGFVLRDGAGGARTDTLPSAAAMVAAVPGCMVGTSFQIDLRNISGTAIAITLAAGPGVTLSPAATNVPQNNTGTYMVVVTSITPGAEAYTVYSQGICAF